MFAQSLFPTFSISLMIVAFMWQSCNGERAASHTNRIKTKGRSLLDDNACDDITFNIYNMPELHEMNLESALGTWISDGRQYGVFKNAESSVFS
mmetsp:Transcript_21886/g.68547  ORF Transcript_21886/g.68547 Transcript_21886/m.68547 type:complete len:94 (-) Transcript_21886:127-408(-)